MHVYTRIYPRAYLPGEKNTPGEKRHSADVVSRTAIYTGWARCTARLRRAIARQDFRKMVRARVRCGAVTKRRRRRERANERASKRARWEEKEKKRQRSTSFLSRLPGRTVCILSRAAPREFNSIFNLPKPLYANSATDVEYFWTFSSRFCVPSASRSPLPLPTISGTSLFLSHTHSLSPPPFSLSLSLYLIRPSPWRSFLPFESVERKEAHVPVTSCPFYECCKASLREEVLNKAAV